MAVTVPKQTWKQYFRVHTESSYGSGGASGEWYDGKNGGANGWVDMAVVPGAVRFTPNEAQLFAQNAAGKRAINQQAPIAGAYDVTGSAEMPVYPELIDRFLYALMGSVSRTETAGSMDSGGAQSLATDPITITPSTQSDGTEQIKIVLASTGASTDGTIEIQQGGTTLETITVGTNATNSDGTYYSRGGYDGSSTNIDLVFTGLGTSGTATITGIDYNTNVFTFGTSVVSLEIEEGGQPKSASNSGFYQGLVVPSMEFNFDRTAADGMLMATANWNSQFPTYTTAGTYANDAKNFYYPTAAWTCSITKGGSAFEKLQSATMTLTGNSALFPVASGNQDPSGAYAGASEVTGTFTILPEDATEWNAFAGQTVGDYELTFTLPQNIVDTTGWSIKFEFSELYTENYVENVQEDLFGADLTFRTTDDASDGISKVTIVSRMAV
jgi:hypothetical protein